MENGGLHYLTVTCGLRLVVAVAVAHDAQQVVVGIVGRRDGNVYLEVRAAHKRRSQVALLAQSLAYLVYQHMLLLVVERDRRCGQMTVLGKLEEGSQSLDTLGRRAAQVYLAGCHRREHHHLVAGTRDSHVQTALAARVVERSEVHRHIAVLVGSVAYREEDDVALIALHVLQVLHEDRLVLVVGDGFQSGVMIQFVGQDILDEVLLYLAERHDADAELLQLGVLQTAYHLVDDGTGFSGVAARVALVVFALYLYEAHLRHLVVDRGEGVELVVIVL